METYRIDEDTIKVILGPEDLENRGVTMLDLLGNRKQIETFFYSILDEIDVDHSFANNEAVTFQVMPETKSNGLVLLISKGNSQIEQIKNNLENNHKQNNLDQKDWESFFKENLDIETKDAENLDTAIDEIEKSNQSDEDEDSPKRNIYESVVKFDSFEDFIMLSENLSMDGVVSNLWLYDNQYYLDILIFINEIGDYKLKEILAIVNEFSQKSTKITAAVLSEFGKKIMSNSALETARKYFK